jgi:hypothetical protein
MSIMVVHRVGGIGPNQGVLLDTHAAFHAILRACDLKSKRELHSITLGRQIG